MRRSSIVATVVVFITVLAGSGAVATPPTGDLKYEDYARAQLQGSASVPITPGSTLIRGSYSIAPGGKTGWRRLSGTTVLAVTKGTLMLHSAEGCAAKEYGVGQAAVAPAGTYMVHNSGNDALEFFGAFIDQPAGARNPLAEAPMEATPASCTGVMAADAPPSGLSVVTSAAAAFVPAYYNQQGTLEIKAGQDVFATQYDVSPGWNSGWFAHYAAINVMEAGDLTYVEAKDGKCDESEVYHGGDAFYHPRHRHMAANNGKDHVLITTIYFGLPHEPPLPGPAGNQLAAADFSQAPPADCPRLR